MIFEEWKEEKNVYTLLCKEKEPKWSKCCKNYLYVFWQGELFSWLTTLLCFLATIFVISLSIIYLTHGTFIRRLIRIPCEHVKENMISLRQWNNSNYKNWTMASIFYMRKGVLSYHKIKDLAHVAQKLHQNCFANKQAEEPGTCWTCCPRCF